MKTGKKIFLCILALIVIAGIVCIGLFINKEKKFPLYSTYCMDHVRAELGEELSNINFPYAEKVGKQYLYSGNVNYKGIKYNFFCSVLNKDNVNLKLKMDTPTEDTQNCNNVYNPICGEDGKVYSNGCYLYAAGTMPDYALGINKNNECEKLTKEDLYGTRNLVGFNDVQDVRNYDVNVSMAISDNGISAKFCNELSSTNFSLSGNMFIVENMVQNLKACKSEMLMDAENEFNLSGAQFVLRPNKLHIWTSNGDIYDFFKNDEELELSEIEKLKQSFEGIVINGKVDENQLSSSQPNTIQFNIEGKNTLYFLDEFGLAFTLGKEWEGGKIENAYEGKYLASVWLKKSGNKTYGFFLIDNEYYHNRQENPEPDEELVGENNKYHIVMRTVKNGGKDGSFDLVVYDVE